MKIHIGADSKTGLVHSASVTAGNVHDSQVIPDFLHGEETQFYGDSAYRGARQREQSKAIAPKAKDFTNTRAYRNRPLIDTDKDANWRRSSMRSKVEQPLLRIKRMRGFAKVRYRGLANKAHRAFAMQDLINVTCGIPLTGRVRPESVKCGGTLRFSAQTDLNVMKESFNSSHQQRISKMPINLLTYSVFP